VQAIITSPPYWGLRKYDIPDITIGEWQGQYGLEPSVQEYVEHTLLWAKEAYRVLKDDGLFFLNLGDKYLNNTLLKIPDRVAISLLDGGWLLRNDIVWHKPNGIPGSMKSRFISRHEKIYMLSKSKDYYFDLDAVRAPYKPSSVGRVKRSYTKSGIPASALPDGKAFKCSSYECNPIGANPGDIWIFSASNAVGVEHYAMWPEKLVERMVLCSSRPGDAVLDPFCGSGTTLAVADRLNREGIGTDLGYQDIQERRLSGVQKELLSYRPEQQVNNI